MTLKNTVCCALSVVLLSALVDGCQDMVTSFVDEFGRRIRELREERTMSQEDLADKAGLHRTHISLIERGQRSVRVETIEKLAIALRVQPSELMPEIMLPKV